jgi:hypothetical protein
MKITNLGVGNSQLPAQSAIGTTAAADSDEAAPKVALASSTYAPSPEFQRLIDQARSEPAVRADRVQAAVTRLQQGYYHTSTSIDHAAQAILNSAD